MTQYQFFALKIQHITVRNQYHEFNSMMVWNPSTIIELRKGIASYRDMNVSLSFKYYIRTRPAWVAVQEKEDISEALTAESFSS